jgi:UDP-glucose 4-epimerase
MAVAFSNNTIGKVLNIGNDSEISINRLAQLIISETNSKSEIVHIPYSEAYGDGFEDMERRVPNIDLIHQLVGWRPLRNLPLIISDIAAEMRKGL